MSNCSNEIWDVEVLPPVMEVLDLECDEVKAKAIAAFKDLQKEGPKLSRPKAGVLKNSKYPNLKELRFTYKRGVYRFFYIFDENRKGFILCGGNKSGVKDFYEKMIPKAEKIYRQVQNR